MLNDDTIVKQSYQLIHKDLGLEEEWECEDSENTFSRLEDFLTYQIKNLLDHDFNRLLNAFYRIDIPEKKVKEILTSSEPELVARDLAVLIIEREKQKVLTRLKYRTS